MQEVSFEELIEKQSSFEWLVGCPENEAQYVVKQPTVECGADIYARDMTEEERVIHSDMSSFGRVK